MTTSPVTPARARALAAAAEDLAWQVMAVQAVLTADPSEHRRLTAGGLAQAVAQCEQVAAALHQAAGELARIAAVPAAACEIGWGVCPDHGNTLTSHAGQSWCDAAGCGRRWGYDRLASPCPEPATHRVTDQTGTLRICTGHIPAAQALLAGAALSPLDPI